MQPIYIVFVIKTKGSRNYLLFGILGNLIHLNIVIFILRHRTQDCEDVTLTALVLYTTKTAGEN